MKGRRKKSPELRSLQGDTGHRKKVVASTEPPALTVDKNLPANIFSSLRRLPPAWMSDDAKAIWVDRLPIALGEAKLQESGLQVFAMYCDALYRLEKYSWEIQKEGDTYTPKSGYRRKRPQVDMRDRALKDLRACASELNLAPKSWISSIGNFVGSELQMFLHGGRVLGPEAQSPDAANAVHNDTPDV